MTVIVNAFIEDIVRHSHSQYTHTDPERNKRKWELHIITERSFFKSAIMVSKQDKISPRNSSNHPIKEITRS